MTERERFIKALRREPIEGHCPHFELAFFLTLESIGKITSRQMQFSQWNQMSHTERELHRQYMADVYIEIAEKYHHSAIYIEPNPWSYEDIVRILEVIREKSGDKYCLLIPGDPTFDIPNGNTMMEFSCRMFEDEEGLKAEAQQRTDGMIAFMERIARHEGLFDGFALCSDYCFNTNPFFSPAMFEEFVAPYLEKTVRAYHSMGKYVIKHTDGNIMPILDQLVQCGPDALHSLDPQGGVDLAEIKRLYGDRIALCGNVNCGLLQTGTEEQVVADVRRSLRDGMEGWGYIFCTSNCVYTGLPLERYELMHRIWLEEGIYR